MMKEVLENTMRTTAMVMLMIIASDFLNFVISAIGLTTLLTNYITGLGLSKTEMLATIVVLYLSLGCFLETLSLMSTTNTIVAPVMFGLSFDPVWFGYDIT